MALTSITLSAAGEFSITQIADEKRINREPVISDTGLVAWSAYNNTDSGDTMSEIVIYTNGIRRIITEASFLRYYGNIKPQVQSNSVVWVASFSKIEGAEPNWILKEVPDDGGAIKELPASYRLTVQSDGKQVFTPSDEPTPVDTNAPAATNAAGEAASTASTSAAVSASAVITNPPPRQPSGDAEICLWSGDEEFEKITKKLEEEGHSGSETQESNIGILRITSDYRNDFGPSFWERLVSWQKAKGWPFGWEIMKWDDGIQMQLTTNYYYDMAPKVYKDQIAWYGWDGHDFEIFYYSKAGGIVQITSNRYDDVSPVIWDGAIAWEGYAGIDADIFLWQNGSAKKVSENIEDDLNPRIWNGQVVWQGFDGDDFEIYLYDGAKTIKLTSNTYDDVNPDIRDNLICWMGYYENWDAEIFVWTGGPQPIKLTDNDVEDRDPRTAGGRIVWQTDNIQNSLIYLATPK